MRGKSFGLQTPLTRGKGGLVSATITDGIAQRQWFKDFENDREMM